MNLNLILYPFEHNLVLGFYSHQLQFLWGGIKLGITYEQDFL